jgi:hypothetical protein
VRRWCRTSDADQTTKKPPAAGLGLFRGAGDENRTRALSLGSSCSTIKLHPRSAPMIGSASPHTLPHRRPPACSPRGLCGVRGGWTRVSGAGVGGVAWGLGVPLAVASCSSPNVAVSFEAWLGKGLDGVDGAHPRPLCRRACFCYLVVPDAAARVRPDRSWAAHPLPTLCTVAAGCSCGARGALEARSRG